MFCRRAKAIFSASLRPERTMIGGGSFLPDSQCARQRLCPSMMFPSSSTSIGVSTPRLATSALSAANTSGARSGIN
jgi:hypothetical protein